MTKPIRPKVRDSIIRALQAGVVPNIGLQHIQVGRSSEVKATLRDIERIADEGASFRIISGEYGAGKTFFLHLVKQVALEHKLITMNADLSPERRLVASNGQARNLYSELIANMSTRSRAEGGALASILEKFIGQILHEAANSNINTETLIASKLQPLSELVAGFDIIKVITQYCVGHENNNETLKLNAVRWLRGEYTTKTEARMDLGVRTIIDDNMLFDAIRLIAEFAVIAGYKGLLVSFDEAVNLYKITHTVSRKANYEMLLKMLNATLQGEANHLGLIFGFTPESLEDTYRGVYSYEALSSRLAPNDFSQKTGLVDFNQPVISLQPLSPEELFILLDNIRKVYADNDESQYLVNDDEIKTFMAHCNEQIGSAYFKTPRESIKKFVHLLSLLEQHPETKVAELIGEITIKEDYDPTAETSNDDLAKFQL